MSLAAAKSTFGHAETGAGAVGLLEAVKVRQAFIQAPMLHLREMNPYVSGIFEASTKSEKGAALLRRLRAPAIAPCVSGSPDICSEDLKAVECVWIWKAVLISL